MAYSESRIVIGGLAHVPVLIFITNFIKGKFFFKTENVLETVIKEEPSKRIKTKETLVKEEKTKFIKELTSKIDNIEEKAEEIIENVKKKKKVKKQKKKKDMKRD